MTLNFRLRANMHIKCDYVIIFCTHQNYGVIKTTEEEELFLFFVFSLFRLSVNSDFIMKNAKRQIILMEFYSKQESSGQGYGARIVQNCSLSILNQNISRYSSERRSS